MLNPSELEQAREWLMDCQWADVDADDIASMPAEDIERAVSRHFDGGLDAFLATC